MFGYVVANVEDASDEEKARYHAAYCGLCRTLGRRCGQRCRLTLNYDTTFLVLLLESLYEPAVTMGRARCATHPFTKHDYACSEVVDYAADVTVALAYHKCLDDWADDKNAAARVGAAALGRAYGHVRERLPRQCAAIERELAAIGDLERAGRKRAEQGRAGESLPTFAERALGVGKGKRANARSANACSAMDRAGETDKPNTACDVAGSSAADEAANAFGRLMAELFVREEDMWSNTLRAMGFHLGRFIYLMDATCDFERDAKRGSYNPLVGCGYSPQEMEMPLSIIAGSAVAEFEKLPLEQDLHLLRNVLYSGIWQKYNVQFKGGDHRDEAEASEELGEMSKEAGWLASGMAGELVGEPAGELGKAANRTAGETDL